MKFSLTNSLSIFAIMTLLFLGCKNTKKVEEKASMEVIEETDLTEIDFIAQGKNWRMEIDFAREAKVILKKDSSVISSINYSFSNGKTTNPDFNLTILNDGCSPQNFYSVQLTVDEKKLEGCGYFLNSSYELIGIWSPENNEDQNINFMSPVKIKGHDGCNQFFGHYNAKKGQIDFQAISRTKKMCPEDEINLSAVTDGFVNYRVSADTLWLQSGEADFMLLRTK